MSAKRKRRKEKEAESSVIPYREAEIVTKVFETELGYRVRIAEEYVLFSPDDDQYLETIGIDIGWKHVGIVGVKKASKVSFVCLLSVPGKNSIERCERIVRWMEDATVLRPYFEKVESIRIENQLGTQNKKTLVIATGLYFYLTTRYGAFHDVKFVSASFKTYFALNRCFPEDEVLCRRAEERLQQKESLVGAKNKPARKKASVEDFELICSRYEDNLPFRHFFRLLKKNKDRKKIEKIAYCKDNVGLSDLDEQWIVDLPVLDKLDDLTDAYFMALSRYAQEKKQKKKSQ